MFRGDRLKELRTERKMSMRELAVLCDTSKSAIGMYEKGKRSPKYETMEAIADTFNVDIDYLLGKSEIRNRFTHSLESYSVASTVLEGIARPVLTKRLPMLGNVACGEPIFANEEHESYIEANADLDADFCLTAKGDSMINARIFDGDILFVKAQDTVDDGEIAVVLIDNEATVKRVYYDKENNVITLVPENPTHKPLRYTGEKLNQIRILGKVLAGQYKVD